MFKFFTETARALPLTGLGLTIGGLVANASNSSVGATFAYEALGAFMGMLAHLGARGWPYPCPNNNNDQHDVENQTRSYGSTNVN